MSRPILNIDVKNLVGIFDSEELYYLANLVDNDENLENETKHESLRDDLYDLANSIISEYGMDYGIREKRKYK